MLLLVGVLVGALAFSFESEGPPVNVTVTYNQAGGGGTETINGATSCTWQEVGGITVLRIIKTSDGTTTTTDIPSSMVKKVETTTT